jgi:hypothetical protein
MERPATDGAGTEGIGPDGQEGIGPGGQARTGAERFGPDRMGRKGPAEMVWIGREGKGQGWKG